jgi:hypothetical protein
MMGLRRGRFDAADCAGLIFFAAASICRQQGDFPMAWSAVVFRIRWLLSGLVACGLWACSSTPLPPWQPVLGGPPAAASAPASAAAAAASAPAAAASASAIEMPVAAVPAPYGPAVAARFPDPAVEFHTPAFQPGRDTFTSNAELQEVMRGLVRDGASGGDRIKLLSLGSSQEGEPLQALLFTRLAGTEPADIVASGRPTVLLVGQQHGDEPAGSEALLVVAEALAHGGLEALLDRINVIVMPRANPDGARRQTRATATGIDVNRDHLLLKTPEAQAQARLVRDYRPMVVVDSHEYTVVGRYLEKFGAIQAFDALIQYAMTPNMAPFITKASEEWFRQPLVAKLKREGLSSEWYYTTSTDLADKKVSMGGVRPDTGRNVNGLTNAVSFLIETRGVGLGRLHLKRRVFTHVTAVSSLLNSTAARAADLGKLRGFVDNDVSAHACQGDVEIGAAMTPSEYGLRMLDPQTGADKLVTVTWNSALQLRALNSRARPCGYWLSADQSDAVTRLRGLGVAVQQLDELGEMRGEIYHETSRSVGVRSDVRGSIADAEGVVHVKVETVPALLDVKAGSYYVPLDQPLANLAVAALEPDTQDSFVANRIVSSVDGEARVMSPPLAKMTPLP